MVPDSAIELTGFSVHCSDRTKKLTGKSRGGVFVSISTTRGVMKGTYTLLNPSAPLIWNHVDWDTFRAASDDDIEAYSDSVTCFIRKCIEDVISTKTIRIYPNQKLWINSDVRSALSARTSAFKSEIRKH